MANKSGQPFVDDLWTAGGRENKVRCNGQHSGQVIRSVPHYREELRFWRSITLLSSNDTACLEVEVCARSRSGQIGLVLGSHRRDLRRHGDGLSVFGRAPVVAIGKHDHHDFDRVTCRAVTE